MNKTHKRIIAAVLAVLLVAGVSAYAAIKYGSKDDPLITKSYLDSVVQPQMEKELQDQLNAAQAGMQSSVAGEFTELSLSSGNSVKCSVGSELLLRSGSAKALGSLVDTTTGSNVSAGGALTANHLYMAVEDGSGLTAAASAVILVSGSYSKN